MKALFLTTILPHGKQMGSEVASQALIDGLRANGVEVDVVGYVRPGDHTRLARGEIAVQSRYIESRNAKFYPLLWLLCSVAWRQPYTAAKYRSADYGRLVAKLTEPGNYDFVVIDHPQMGWAVRSIVCRDVPLVFVAHNVEHDMYAQLAAQSGIGMRAIFSRESKLVERMENWLAGICAEIWTLTAHDAKHFEASSPTAKIREIAIPASATVRVTTAGLKEFDVALIGNWAWAANREALIWFLDEVCEMLPSSMSIRIAGKGAEFAASRYPNVHYVGFVPDAVAFLQSAKVVAIPTLSGGGIQIKTLDSIASGSLVVATQCAVRGISDLPDTVTVVSDVDSFAAQLVSVVHGPCAQERSDHAHAWSAARSREFVLQMQRACHALKLQSAGDRTFRRRLQSQQP